MTIKEVADLKGVTPGAIQAAIYSGRLKAYDKDGKVYIEKEDAENYIPRKKKELPKWNGN
jgi:predicted site-specific integrase-resolvase